MFELTYVRGFVGALVPIHSPLPFLGLAHPRTPFALIVEVLPRLPIGVGDRRCIHILPYALLLS